MAMSGLVNVMMTSSRHGPAKAQKAAAFAFKLPRPDYSDCWSRDGGKYKLTDLGGAVMDPNQARVAKANAFMNVPLFKAIFEKYKGGVLPAQAAALEREIVGLGVL